MNRCLAVALVIVVVSASMNDLQDAMDSLLDETDLGIISAFKNLPAGFTAKGSIWNSMLWWPWGSEEIGPTRRRKKPSNMKGILKAKNKE